MSQKGREKSSTPFMLANTFRNYYKKLFPDALCNNLQCALEITG